MSLRIAPIAHAGQKRKVTFLGPKNTPVIRNNA